MESIYNLARRAYTGDTEARNVPVERKTKAMTITEMAKLGYEKSAREQELKRSPARPALRNVLTLIDQGRMPEALRPLAERPPTREEAIYLPRDVQRLVDDLVVLDKAVESIPNLEKQLKDLQLQKEDWTREAIRYEVTDKSEKAGGIDYPHQTESVQRALTNLSTERDSIIRGSAGFVENNPHSLEKGISKLDMLRQELQAPMPYQEAKSGLQPLKKPVLEWLKDLRDKPSFEDRLEAKAVLEAGGIDAEGIIKDVERSKMHPIDRAVAEYKDREAGKGQASQPASEADKAKTVATKTTQEAPKPESKEDTELASEDM